MFPHRPSFEDSTAPSDYPAAYRRRKVTLWEDRMVVFASFVMESVTILDNISGKAW
jgi:hypothetical protein